MKCLLLHVLTLSKLAGVSNDVSSSLSKGVLKQIMTITVTHDGNMITMHLIGSSIVLSSSG